MKYAVDKIEDNIALLENLETKEKKEIDISNMKIKEGDILVYIDGVYVVDIKERENRLKKLREKLDRLK